MCSLGRDILNGNCALQMREIWGLVSGERELEGVLFLKPYLTAWINSPLFHRWAGNHPLFLVSLRNHAVSLSLLQCTVSHTGITNRGSAGWVRAHCTIVRPGMLAWLEVPAFWICLWIHVTANCTKTPFKYSPGSPFHISKCTPDLKL